MSPRLRSCQGCSRHVYVTESVCPFCKVALAPAVQRAQPKMPSGFSRAQRLAMAAALAGPLAGCPDDAPNPGSPSAGSNAEAGSPSAAEGGTGGWGSAGTGVAGKTGAAGKGSGTSGHVAVPLYGAPLAGNQAPPVAGKAGGGSDEDAGQAGEGGTAGSGHMVHPLYGAPVPLYGAPAPRK
jgi:hypothetical protein